MSQAARRAEQHEKAGSDDQRSGQHEYMAASEGMTGAIREVAEQRIEDGIQHQAKREADSHQPGRQAHHGVIKEQHEQAGNNHQDGDGHFSRRRRVPWRRAAADAVPAARELDGDMAGMLMDVVQSRFRVDQRAATTSPAFCRTGSRKNCRICPVSNSGCSSGPKCSPPGSSTGLQLGSAVCR